MVLDDFTGADCVLLGPRTCAYLALAHGHNDERRLLHLARLALTERRQPSELPTLLVPGWQAGALALLLGRVLDAQKSRRLLPERADQYRAEAGATHSPTTLLRLLVKLHAETNPTQPHD